MTTTSFLPEDYLDQRAERRTNMVSLTLFGVVMVSVFAAFLVTNRQWSKVRSAQASINRQYQDAASQIERLNELEKQKDQMLNKARLAAALVERVPRSILLAELVNRMPAHMGLLELELKSDKVKVKAPSGAPEKGTGSLGKSKAPRRARTRADLEGETTEVKIEAPRYLVGVTLVGVAPTDVEVSRYMAELNAHPLLQNVSLQYSEERKFEGDKMRQFEIKMHLNGDLDVRDVAPLIKRDSITNPMDDAAKFAPGAGRDTAAATPRGTGGP